MPARTIAIYGKGGIGKSFTTTNLSATFSLMQKRVLQLGCDPKHDSTTSLFGGISLPTVTEVFGEKTHLNEKVRVEDIVFKRKLPGFPEDIFGIELGGPDVGRGCGGRGIISGFDVLEKLGLFKWELDLILMDFLGDVVCGGFATPLARSLCQDVILVVSNDRQSIFAANNICTANNHFKTVGGSSRLLGLIVNRDDGSGIAERYAKAAGINVLMKLPYSSAARDKSDSFDVAIRLPEIYAPFQNLAERIWEEKIAPCESRGLSYKEFMDLFGEVDKRVPEAATIEDLHLDKNLDLDARSIIEEASSIYTIGSLPEEDEFVTMPHANGISDGKEKTSEKPAMNHLSDQEKLSYCISLLPPVQKDILTLFEIKKKSIDEIAIEQQLDRDEVEAVLNTARAALKELFFSA
ncbi:MAG: chlorophyllide a reductase iron protein subunit X [Chlorobiales bacterium]|nr:chlorophyllide a reductase iron protein subunit X [Chlorobiales bacterium]